MSMSAQVEDPEEAGEVGGGRGGGGGKALLNS